MNISQIEAFSLLQSIFLETKGLSLQYIANWDLDIHPIDLEIRHQLLYSNKLYNEIRQQIKTLSVGAIYTAQDSLGMHYVFFRGDYNKKDFYSFGPFRASTFDDKELSQIKKNNQLKKTSLEELQFVLGKVPCGIYRTEVLSIARHVLRSFYSREEPSVHELIWNLHSNEVQQLIPAQDLDDRIKRIEEVYLHENKLCGFVSEGNYAKAMREANFFLKIQPHRRGFEDSTSSHRSYLYTANTIFRKAAQSVFVHPYYLDEISQRFAQKINLCISHQQLQTVYLEMVEDYCKLCREYANRKYGRSVRIITNYISFHLCEELTPDIIAEAINFSPNYISRKVKEEMGIPLMHYIAQQRIILAQKLIRNTNMTIKEIAIYVGISDWNYFTKIFKNGVGITPSQYRKELKNK